MKTLALSLCTLVGVVVVGCYYDTEASTDCCDICGDDGVEDTCACGDKCVPCNETCDEAAGCACNQ